MKITTKKVLENWLLTKVNQAITYHNIEQEVPIFGRAYGVKHNASSYCRGFRKIKEESHKLLKFIKQEDNGVADSWLIKKRWED